MLFNTEETSVEFVEFVEFEISGALNCNWGIIIASVSPTKFSAIFRNIILDCKMILFKLVRKPTTRNIVKIPILNDYGFFIISAIE
jgi:hypothetical protein